MVDFPDQMHPRGCKFPFSQLKVDVFAENLGVAVFKNFRSFEFSNGFFNCSKFLLFIGINRSGNGPTSCGE